MSAPASRVLVVEDDADSASILLAYLERDGFDVRVARDGREGVDLFHRWSPDLVLLDMMLPRMTGAEVLAEVRRRDQTPVIMVTALGDEPEKLAALRYGADDYVVKPYSPSEVVARVRAVLRRSARNQDTPHLLRHGALTVDLQAFSAVVDLVPAGRVVLDLTPTEFSILATLIATPFKAFSRAELFEKCMPASNALERSIDTHVHNLRRKLELSGVHDVVVTVRSIGYRFR